MIRTIAAIFAFSVFTLAHADTRAEIVATCTLRGNANANAFLPKSLELRIAADGETIAVSDGKSAVELSFYTDDDPEVQFQGETKTMEFMLDLDAAFVNGKKKKTSASLSTLQKKAGASWYSGSYSCSTS